MKAWSVFCAGSLLAACGGLTPHDGGRQTVAALESACVGDPLDAAKWERLAAALGDSGDDGDEVRALAMRRQAATLRAHDLRRDYTLLERAMPRTEVRRLNAAMVEVLRVAPDEGPRREAASLLPPSGPEEKPRPRQAAGDDEDLAAARLEISNGNGVTGAAARMAGALRRDGLKVVRLSNLKPYAAPHSRIEYRPRQQALAQAMSHRLDLPLRETAAMAPRTDLRIVLGHDARSVYRPE